MSPEIWVGGRSGMRDQFIKILVSTDRIGIADLLNWIEGTDFYRAPASSQGHNNYEGGLLEHSLEVYFKLLDVISKVSDYPNIPSESIAISALLHDICKANFYHADGRNRKDAVTGKWFIEPYFSIDDKFPLGHGEKSVIVIQQFMKLTPNEIIAIRWHMAGFDDSARAYAGGLAMTKAYKEYPLAVLLHVADLLACYPGEEKR